MSGQAPTLASEEAQVLRVFIFAGQSNMVGSDSKVADIDRFPPFRGLEHAQPDVRFLYCLGRETKRRSDGWVDLQPVNRIVGPELSFARKITREQQAPIAIIKCAAGGTHLGGDWNPEQPSGFKMYPLLLDVVRDALARLDAEGVSYRLEGFMWHQGENDMFNQDYMDHYGKNLAQFIAAVRRDLGVPNLPFFIGELCTKTIWGMDLRPRMYAISLGQKEVTSKDALAYYVPTAHVGVEIGNPVGLHYHYGTLGQLEHGVNYADAYLASTGTQPSISAKPEPLPYPPGSKIKLCILAGHRNMEGERAFVQDLEDLPEETSLVAPQQQIAYKYHLGGGYKKSNAWERLRPAGYYDTFGPELSFGRSWQALSNHPIAIAKMTHSGSQIIDWTPAGSDAVSRNLYPAFMAFIRESIEELETQGYKVELAGIWYHLGENDMSFGPFRRNAPAWLASMIRQSRLDLSLPSLRWIVTQQPPTDAPKLNQIDVTAQIEQLAAKDPHLTHVKTFELPGNEKRLVYSTAGIVRLGEIMAETYLKP